MSQSNEANDHDFQNWFDSEARMRNPLGDIANNTSDISDQVGRTKDLIGAQAVIAQENQEVIISLLRAHEVRADRCLKALRTANRLLYFIAFCAFVYLVR